MTVYERDPSLAHRGTFYSPSIVRSLCLNLFYSSDSRPISFLVHWGFQTLEDLLPEDLWKTINQAFCNPSHDFSTPSEGLTFFQGHTGELLFQTPPGVMMRVARQKLRRHISKGVDIHWSHSFESFETLSPASENLDVNKTEGDGGSVKIKFADGSEDTADILIGADGPQSKIRKQLLGEEKAALTKTDFVCGYASAVLGKEVAEAMLQAHPIWAMAYHSMGVAGIGGRMSGSSLKCPFSSFHS